MIFVVEAIGRRTRAFRSHRMVPVAASTRMAEADLQSGGCSGFRTTGGMEGSETGGRAGCSVPGCSGAGGTASCCARDAAGASTLAATNAAARLLHHRRPGWTAGLLAVLLNLEIAL